jgi:quercetin 2,3-dioxygenase
MLTTRLGSARGVTNIGWLDSRHSFAFGDYYDPAHTGYRSLRVINDDRIGPGGGFPMHPHRDMEILTWVLSGELEHKDSMGTGSVVKAGEWQRMTAGTGVRHSEFNPSPTTPVRLLQIWLFPHTKGLTPAYEQKAFGDNVGKWETVASPDGRDGSLTINQDAVLSTAVVRPGDELTYRLSPGRGVWAQAAGGRVTVNGVTLRDGDAVYGDESLTVGGDGTVLVFDL